MKTILTILACLVFTTSMQAQAPNWMIWNMTNSALIDNRAYYVEIDQSNNNKWICTMNGGLFRMNLSGFQTFQTFNSGLPSNAVRECQLDPYGDLWISTATGGIAKYDGQNFTTFNTGNSGLVTNESWALFADSQGVWVGNGMGGLVRYDGQTWVNYNTSNSGLPHNWINFMRKDSAGVLWIGTGGGGLARFDGQTWVTYNTSNSGLASDYIWHLMFDRNGVLWVGNTGGLSRFDGQNWQTYNTANSAIPGNEVPTIAEDASGNLWVGTVTGGVGKYDGSTWTTYNTLNSTLPDNYIETIAISPYDYVWVGMNSGGLAGIKEDSLVTVGVSEPKIDMEIAVWPNPCSDFVHVDLSPKQGKGSYAIISMDGRVVAEGEVVVGTQRLALQTLARGTYLLEVRTGKGRWIKKIMVEK